MITKEFIEKTFSLALTNAEKKAVEKKIYSGDLQKLHALRAREWVEALANSFREHFKVDENIRVFSKYYESENGEQRKDFGLNELLFDISVVKINKIESPRHKELTYIEKALWLVESEMAKDTRQLVLDFSKLVIGDVENKLFIGPLTSHDEEIMGIFKKIAVNCRGNVWVVLIPHPGEWGENKNTVFLEQIKSIN
jgi:hypothetical protein